MNTKNLIIFSYEQSGQILKFYLALPTTISHLRLVSSAPKQHVVVKTEWAFPDTTEIHSLYNTPFSAPVMRHMEEKVQKRLLPIVTLNSTDDVFIGDTYEDITPFLTANGGVLIKETDYTQDSTDEQALELLNSLRDNKFYKFKNLYCYRLADIRRAVELYDDWQAKYHDLVKSTSTIKADLQQVADTYFTYNAVIEVAQSLDKAMEDVSYGELTQAFEKGYKSYAKAIKNEYIDALHGAPTEEKGDPSTSEPTNSQDDASSQSQSQG